MTDMICWVRACLPVAALLLCGSGAGCTEFLITDFGARARTGVVNTMAIQKAIDTCARKGGGVVVVPPGTFVTGSLFLKQGVDFEVQEGAVLKASEKREDFKEILNLWAGTELLGPAALLNAGTYKEKGIRGLRIYGKGTLDGSGAKWWKEFWDYRGRTDKPKGYYNYPKLLSICNCEGVSIEGLRLVDSSFWNLHLLYCRDVVVRNVSIIAPDGAPSSDGIDVDSSCDVLIEGCYISVDDDCISMKSGRDVLGLVAARPTENVTIRNCRFGYGHGCVDCGSEVSGWIRNVHAYNCVVDGADPYKKASDYYNPIVRFKTSPGRGGGAENIIVENFQVKNTQRLISCEIPFSGDAKWETKFAAAGLPLEKGYSKFRNVVIRNISGECDNPGTIAGYHQITFDNVLIENICVTAKNKDAFVVGDSAQGVVFRNICVNGKLVNTDR